jgi:nitroreductase
MEIIDAISARRAYRFLSAEALPDGAARRIVEAGHLAPSCFNNQPWRITATGGDAGHGDAGHGDAGHGDAGHGDAGHGDEPLAALRAALSETNAWAARAPMIIAVAVRASDDCRLEDGRDYALFDAGLCAMNMISQATAEGLVAHPIAGYNPKKAKAALGIDKDYVLAVLIVVARHAEGDLEADTVLMPWQKTAESAPRNRKPLEEVARFL